MNIAFYAPMKPTDAPRPSGDRTIGRMLLRAMAVAGHDTTVASTVRSFTAEPADRVRQQRIERQAADGVRQLIEKFRRDPPDLWFTYHLFHKAPDLIGPAVCRALSLPYLVAEASFAPKRATGPWSGRHELVRDAIGLADHVFFLNPADEACVLPLLKPGASHSRLPPVIGVPDRACMKNRRVARQELARRRGLPPDAVWGLAVGMMRPGDKLASYALLAEAWARCADTGAHLLVVGDGPACGDVRERFAQCANRVSFLGELQPDQLDSVYKLADFYIWPGIHEAIGMATLEAMAAGLPVAVGPWGSVAQEIEPGVTGLIARTGNGFAQAIHRLIDDPALRKTLGAAAQAHAVRRHSLPAAAAVLTAAFDSVAGRSSSGRSA